MLDLTAEEGKTHQQHPKRRYYPIHISQTSGKLEWDCEMAQVRYASAEEACKAARLVNFHAFSTMVHWKQRKMSSRISCAGNSWQSKQCTKEDETGWMRLGRKDDIMMTLAGNMLLMAICSRRAGATKKILFTFTVHSGFHFIFPKNETRWRTASVKKHVWLLDV